VLDLHFYPIWEAASFDEWLFNGGPYQLAVCHSFIGIGCCGYSAPVMAATAVFIIYPIGQGSFSDGMPLGISGTFNFMLVFQAEHNILMHPFHMLGVAGVFGGSLPSCYHWGIDLVDALS
jgi:photosystem II P680 reaction center D1 protein